MRDTSNQASLPESGRDRPLLAGTWFRELPDSLASQPHRLAHVARLAIHDAHRLAAPAQEYAPDQNMGI